MSSLYKSFRANILRTKLITSGDSVLVGVSGGVDSMVLFSLLLDLQRDVEFALSAAHVNYGLRGKESDADEKLAADFAAAGQVRCFVAKAGSLGGGGKNFQSAARDFRYRYFAETALAIGANRVAAAHHKEDQVETILGNLLRGSSLKGLAGMRSSRTMGEKTLLIRPLLPFSKKEIRGHAAANRVPHLEDSSNASKEYWRNRLRRDLLPLLEELRPKAFDKIVQLGDEMRELGDCFAETARNWLMEFAKNEENSFWIPRPRWEKLPKTLRLEVLHQAAAVFADGLRDLKRDHLVRCEQIALGEKPEGMYHLPERLQFRRRGDALLLSKSCATLKQESPYETKT